MPIYIHLDTIDGLPDTPISFETLDEKCVSTFIKFKFFETKKVFLVDGASKHSSDLKLNKSLVVLAGLIPNDLLYQSITNSDLRIEVHDRDFKEYNASKLDSYGIASFCKFI